ncbi:hypothetical protein KKG83_05290 [Candidatus Micrarchaeota archaeon]|nr:hypothetical protein [Candidatus Micrarchaeota archaeon]MBU2476858.1 hypothetical protein [Candidatus Micrarchaeota archaeon]
MPKCPKCKKEVKELVLAGSYKYSMKREVYLCENCAKKMNSAVNSSTTIFLVLFFVWLGGIFLGIVPEEFFAGYLLSGIIGLPLILFAFYKLKEGS